MSQPYQPNGNQYYQSPNQPPQFNQQQPNRQINYNDYPANLKQQPHQQQKQQPNFQQPPPSDSYLQQQPVMPEQNYGALNKNFENLSLNNSKDLYSPTELNQSANQQQHQQQHQQPQQQFINQPPQAANSNARPDLTGAQNSPSAFYQQKSPNQSFEYDPMQQINGNQQPPNQVMQNRYPPDPSLSNQMLQKQKFAPQPSLPGQPPNLPGQPQNLPGQPQNLPGQPPNLPNQYNMHQQWQNPQLPHPQMQSSQMMSPPHMSHQQMPPSQMMPPQMQRMMPPSQMMPPSHMMHQTPQQQPKQLNPDSIPSVIQVVEDDKRKFFNENMIYNTCIPSDLPPSETTINETTENGPLKVLDRGCTRPNHMRSSIYHVPNNEEILKNTAIPFNIVIKPFDEFEIEHDDNRIEVPVSPSEIVRCNRCKAYISPFMRFTDGGRRFQCAMCHHISEVSETYYAPLDHTEQRLDKFQRPELHLGSYEFRTNEEFYRNKVMASRRPHIVFAFELTMNSRPIIQLISANLAQVIKNSLPLDQALNCPPPLVGFITYNSKIQLYDILNNSTAHIISDVANTFPSFTTFLIDPIQHMDKIEDFLHKLPSLYSENELETETILGPVIEAAFQTCNADSSNWFPNQDVKDKSKVLAVGKIYLFHCSLATFGQDGSTPGRLKKRWTTVDEEVKRLLGTDKEKNILTPEPSKYYTKLGEKCVTEYGSGVELFLFPPANGSFLDIATISELTRLTGTGGLYKYFNDYSTRFLHDLKQSLRSTMAFDILLKVRTSTGIRPVDYVGNYYSSNVSDIQIASLNAGNSISVEFKYDDKLDENEFVIIQVATLYTAVSGDRRVRVHNLVLQTCTELADVFRGACCDSLINHLFRSSVQSLRLGSKTIHDVKGSMINRVVQILTSYRRNCASPGSSPGQLILPETLKLLPVYLTGAIKCDAIDGGCEMQPDDKAFAQARSLGANCSYSQAILYPSLLKLQYNQDDKLETQPLRSAFYRLNTPEGVGYILENGFYLFLYLPSNPEIVNQPKFIQNVFGVNSLADIHPERDLPHLDTEESMFLNSLLDQIRKKRKMTMKVYIVRQGIDKNELIFKCFLYEDNKPLSNVTSGQSNFDAPSYVDLLCHLHKEIRALVQ